MEMIWNNRIEMFEHKHYNHYNFHTLFPSLLDSYNCTEFSVCKECDVEVSVIQYKNKQKYYETCLNMWSSKEALKNGHIRQVVA